MDQPRLIVYAPRIHTGGGLVLLKELLRVPGVSKLLISDPRISVEPDWDLELHHTVAPGLSSYWVGERVLNRVARLEPNAMILCFSNLPPLRRRKNKTVVFVQNRFVVEGDGPHRFPLKTKIRHILERFLFRRSRENADSFIVQSASMARAVRAIVGERSVPVLPFNDDLAKADGNGSREKDLDFLYVATPDPHKNHSTLLAAWELLAKRGVRPSLGLTLRETDPVWTRARELNETLGTRIVRLSSNEPGGRKTFYARSKALVFPSTFESYGLPLLEAAQNGLPILAGELDFVRDSVEPAETFDPRSEVSLARAVLRWLGQPERPTNPASANEFVTRLLNL